MSVPTPSQEKSLPASPLKPVLPAQAGGLLYWSRLYGSACGLAIVHAAREHPGPLLVVTRGVHAAEQLEDEIRFYAAGDGVSGAALGNESSLPVLHFPDWECLPYDVVSPHQGIVSERLETLYRLPTLTRGILLAAAGTLMHRIAPREYVAAHSFLLRRGERLDVAGLRTTLTHAGYATVSQVMEPGEFAVRGGVIDLFPTGNPTPTGSTCSATRSSPSVSSTPPANVRAGRSRRSGCCRHVSYR